MSKLFFHNYYHNVMVKCHRNVNLEEMDTELVQQEKYGLWVLWTIFQEHIKQNITMAVLKKILIQLSFADWETIQRKRRPKEKNRYKFFPSCQVLIWGFNKMEYYAVHILWLFIDQKRLI